MSTNKEIIEAVKNCDCIEPNKESQKPISPAKALRFICGILTFLEEHLDRSFKVDDSLIQNLEKLKKEVNSKLVTSKHQAILDTFILAWNWADQLWKI
ncbi:12205_t:CDS:2 [Cetraspora pellucida]|uniref:12205_t:CDS:1 n=1 Tax=Cetraspora pellucida TaxID=1433469 RepID=A0A9N9BI47_9GLOM|nr:12205_t:CDS:2 [Cetraspora pellucida]